MRATRNDVAKLAGVGASTVSYVLSGKKKFSPEVESKVWKAVKQLNYYPNYNAKQMKAKHGQNICYISEVSINLDHSDIVCGMESVAVKRGDWLNVKPFVTMEMLSEITADLISRKVDGAVLVYLPEHIDPTVVQRLLDNNIKVLMTIPYYPTDQRISQVKIDYMEAMEKIVAYLHEFGHREIGFLDLFRKDYIYDTRLRGFQSAILKYGLGGHVVNLEECGGKNAEDGSRELDRILSLGISAVAHQTETDRLTEILREGIGRLLQEGVTAIAFPNDTTAFIGVNILKEMGLSVPEDISATAVNDTFLCEISNPRLTTLKCDYFALGAEMANTLYNYIDNDICENKKFSLPLVTRDSVAKVKVD